ncbi:MAG: DUF2232 domain-containing protein [Hyphomicrobiales bacterium]
MAIYILIGIIAGLAAAALYATVVTGAAIALLLFYIAPLPLFIVGLGWGAVSAFAGGIAGSLALSVAVDPKLGGVFAITVALAPVVLSHLALKSRPLPADEGQPSPGDEWYPEGRLVMWATGLAVVLVAATLFLTGTGPAQLNELLSEMMERMAALQGGTGVPDTPELQSSMKEFMKTASLFVPAISASVWIAATLLNMALASKVLSASGRNVRDWAPFRNLALPAGTEYAFVIVVACAFLLTGTFGLVAKTAAFSLLTAVGILGLATIHYLVKDFPTRVMILTGLYALLFVIPGIGVFPVLAMGFGELIFGLRARKQSSGGSTPRPPSQPT